MNNLTTLENAIYNSILRLRELSSGCEVEGKYHPLFTVVVFNKNIGAVYGVDKECVYRHARNPDIKILGHPILLNDVLEWMMQYYGFIISNNWLYFNERDFTLRINAIKIDLSKPKLSDQSQELIDALCELIPK